MSDKQPRWECVGQLGDVNPLEYGGYWVLRDQTGHYPEEGEYLEVDDSGEYCTTRTAYRFILDRCTYIDGVLSDNQFHPDYPAWFAKYVHALASAWGQDDSEVIADFCSPDPIRRALAYRSVGLYCGFENLDGYPLNLTKTEAMRRYNRAQYRFKTKTSA